MQIEWINVGITALISALPSAILGGIITNYLTTKREKKKRKVDLNIKNLLIKDDLIKKKKILHMLKLNYQNLDVKIKNDENLAYPNDLFQDLHSDVYDSVSNPDLHQIFGKDFFIVTNVYKAIEHLKEFFPHRIKSNRSYAKS